MFDFHEKRKIRRVVYSKLFITGIFLVTGFILMSAYERFTIEREMAVKLRDRANELGALETRALSLESRVGHLQNERGVEEELRSRFNVVKEGEQVVVILDNEPKETNTSTTSTLTAKEKEDHSFFEMLKFWE